MAHCAEIVDGVVVRVLVISNEYEPNIEQFAIDLFGGNWKQTSFNSNIRKNFAGIGYTYDSTRDAFIPIKPDCHPSEISLDEQTCQWKCDDPSHDLP